MPRKKVVDDPATEVDESLQEETLSLEEATANLNEAKAASAKAEADLAAAKAAHDAATGKEADDAVDVTKHVLVDQGANGAYTPVEFPLASDKDPETGACRARTLTLGGANYEHVGDRTFHDGEGKPVNVWVYRRM